MGQQVTDALEALRRLGNPDELSVAPRGSGGAGLRVNSHIHLPPNFSAFETVQQAVDLAAAQRIDVLGVSNYYDYDVYGDFVACARQHGIFPLFGTEIICVLDDLRDAGVKINDPGNPGKMYICGKGITRFDQMTGRAQRLLQTIRDSDSKRMAAMVERMATVFAERGLPTKIDAEAVIDMIVRRHGSLRSTVYIQERHIAQAFQEALFAQVKVADRIQCLSVILGAPTKAKDGGDFVTIQNEIRSHLMKAGRPAFVEETFVDFDHARRLILELGGIPCYPVLADGTNPICSFERTPEQLVANIQRLGFHAVEFIPIRNGAAVLSRYAHALRQAGMIVTGGTEHNTLDLIPIEPTCVDGNPVQEDVRAMFEEGACVVAAHQFLTLHGRRGYVDADGGVADPQTRIAGLAKLGAAVIARYREATAKA